MPSNGTRHKLRSGPADVTVFGTAEVLTLRSRPLSRVKAQWGPPLAAADVHRGTRDPCDRKGSRLLVANCVRLRVVRASQLAPRSGLNDLITLQNRWSGAGSNRRPSAFQAGHIPSWHGSCESYALAPVAGACRWLLLLLSPLLSAPAGTPFARLPLEFAW